jgi:hypothetical protein
MPRLVSLTSVSILEEFTCMLDVDKGEHAMISLL